MATLLPNNQKKQDPLTATYKKGGLLGFLAGAAGFARDSATNIYDEGKNTVQNIQKVASSEAAANTLKQSQQVRASVLKKHQQTLSSLVNVNNPNDPRWQSPEVIQENTNFDRAINGLNQADQKLKPQLKQISTIDPKKAAADAANTFLNVATLGVASAPKALLENGVKTIAEQGVKQAAKQAVKQTVRGTAEGAAFGGESGGFQGAANGQPILPSVLRGAGTGALLGGAVAGLDGGLNVGATAFKAARGKIAPPVIPKLSDSAKSAIPQPKPVVADATQIPEIPKVNLQPIEKINDTTPQVTAKPTQPPATQSDSVTQEPVEKVTPISNRLTKGAQSGRQNLSDSVTEGLQGQHLQRSTQDLQAQAAKIADGTDLKSTIADAYQRLNQKHISDEDVAQAQQAIERADTAGQTQDAVNLHNMLSEHLTNNGRTIQAASLLYRLSPQGMYYKAVRDITNGAGKDAVTPELQTKLKSIVDEIKSAKSSDEKNFARAKLSKTVVDSIPQGKAQQAISVWKAGLLSNPITHAGNVLSNATFGTLNKISDIPAALVDRGVSLITKNRTKTFTTRGLTTGAAEGVKKAGGTLKTGIDTRDFSTGKFEQHGELNFKNPVIQKVIGTPSNMVFRALSSADQPFYFAAAKNSLYDQALAAAKNAKLTGKAASDFVEKFVDNPSTKAAQVAQHDAEVAVLGETSQIGSAVSKFAQSHPALQTIIPFTKVPTNFIKQTLDYTPVGALSAVFKAARSLKKGEGFNQRDFSTAIGKSATGTSIIALGAALTKSDALSGQYPTTDQKEAQRWKAQGITPNSIHIGNNWYSLNYLGPVGILLQAGKDIHDGNIKDGAGVADALLGLGKTLAGQSFLTGLSGIANAVNDPQQSAKSYINSEASSLVPGFVKGVAGATDPMQRAVNNPLQSIQSGIPGLREGLNPSQDVYGNQLQQRTDPADYLLNPFRPSSAITSPTLNEVQRLHGVDPNNSDLQITPTPIDSSITINGKKVKLTDQQRYDIQNATGQYIQSKWGQLIKTPTYAALSDTDKAKALSDLKTDAQAVAERQFIESNNIAQYTKAPTANQIALANNSGVDQYATSAADASSTSTGVTPADKYTADLVKYQTAVKAGTLSGPKAYAQQQVLNKEAITSQYPQEVLDFYNLSNANKEAYFKANPTEATQLYNQAKQLDNQLVSKGIAKTKFKSTSSGGRSTASRKYEGAAIAVKAPKTSAPPKNSSQFKVPSLKGTTLKRYVVANIPTKVTAKKVA